MNDEGNQELLWQKACSRFLEANQAKDPLTSTMLSTDPYNKKLSGLLP